MPDNNSSNNPEPNGQAPNGSDPQSQADNSNGQAPNGTQKPSLSHEDALRLLSDARREAADARLALKNSLKERDDAANVAEQKRLVEQGEFKKLAEKHEARVKELEPVSERYSTLALQLSAQIETEVKDWPAEVKAFDPGKDAPIEARMSWLQKSRPLLEKLQQQQRGQAPGNRPNPAPTGQGNSREDMDKRNRQSFVRQRNYGV